MAQYPWFLSQRGAHPCESVNPEPVTFRAGDTLQWTRLFDLYPASAGWTLTYVLNSPTGRYVVASADITAAGDQFSILIPRDESKTWSAGVYQWLAIVQNGTQRQTVALGRVSVEFDLLDATAPQDTRTKNEIALSAIQDTLAGRATDGTMRYRIGTGGDEREIQRFTMDELLRLENFYQKRVDQERRDRGEAPPPSTIAVYF